MEPRGAKGGAGAEAGADGTACCARSAAAAAAVAATAPHIYAGDCQGVLSWALHGGGAALRTVKVSIHSADSHRATPCHFAPRIIRYWLEVWCAFLSDAFRKNLKSPKN